ncbi:MAG: hypothetical protein JXA89_28175 [Anaerolineae bacterium]|nr:hypothetical protein [Anaerolineae bacterium]
MKKRILIVGIIVLSLLVMGCSVCGLASKKAKEVAETKVVKELEKIQETATPTPVKESMDKATATKPAAETKATATKAAGETKPEPTPTKSDTGDGGALFEGEQLVSWQALDSYRYELTLHSTQGSEKVNMTGDGAFVKDPPAMTIDLQVESSETGEVALRAISIGTKAYLYDPVRNGWMVIGSDSPMLESVNFGNLMMDEMMVQYDKTKFKLVDEHVNMNGVDCSHYSVAAKDIEADLFDGQGEITSGSANVWIANELGVLIKYEMDIEGKDNEGNPANAQMTLNVLDVNKPVEILPPPEDEILGEIPGLPGVVPTPVSQDGDGIAKTLPKPETATELEGVELTTAQALAESSDADMYKISMSVEDAAAFYESAFVDAGWSKQVSPPVGNGIAVLIFGKDGKTATVMVNGMFSEEEPMVVVFVQ